MARSPVIAIVPAAGSATRFGSQKLLADVDGAPLIVRTIQCLADAGASPIVVVIAPEAQAIRDVVEREDAARTQIGVNPDPLRGMLSSIQTGLKSVSGHPILILPGDMPFVRHQTVAAVAEACAASGRVVVPRHRDRRGHPIAVPESLRAVILAAPSTSTLAELLRQSAPNRLEIEVDDWGVLRDVDVPADLRSR